MASQSLLDPNGLCSPGLPSFTFVLFYTPCVWLHCSLSLKVLPTLRVTAGLSLSSPRSLNERPRQWSQPELFTKSVFRVKLSVVLFRSQRRIVSTKSEIMLPDTRTSKTQQREEASFASFSPLHYPSLSLKTFLWGLGLLPNSPVVAKMS